MISGVSAGGTIVPTIEKPSEKKAEVSDFSADVAQASFINSHIRVDSLLGIAILEVRSGESGDVIRQYPTEKQIEAFQKAKAASDSLEGSGVSLYSQLEVSVDTSNTEEPVKQSSSVDAKAVTSDTSTATNEASAPTSSTQTTESILV